jgi:nitrate reductase gamma subunit
MSDFLHFSEHRLQEAALGFMALVYTLRVIWLLRFKAGKERQGKTGLPSTSVRKGILYSWGIIAMPWAMESSRKNLLMWLQFVIFHLGVVAAIGLSFVIPYGPGLLELPGVVTAIQVATAGACVVGVLRIIRRVSSVYLRALSSPDDYFSVILLTVWFAFACLAAPNDLAAGEGALLTYFLMTAFFLVYVPFSKIGHYLYYPFTRYYFGKSMGYRGTFPLVPSVKPRHNVANGETVRTGATAQA